MKLTLELIIFSLYLSNFHKIGKERKIENNFLIYSCNNDISPPKGKHENKLGKVEKYKL